MKQLTIKEAKEQGYEYYGHAKKTGFQRLRSIDNIDIDGLPEDAVLFDKTPSFVPVISSEEIADILADVMAETCASNTGEDDTDEVYDTVKELDFSQAAKIVNDSLSHKKYYTLTDIKLIS